MSTFTVKKRYVNFPVTSGYEATDLVIRDATGGLCRYLHVEFDSSSETSYAYDMSEYIGQELTLQSNQAEDIIKAITFSDVPLGMDMLYQETNRPQFHFSPQRGWLNDPNGLFYYQGTYHLFFQFNPVGRNWGNMHWGHAVSPDLLHWSEKDIVLYPDEHGTMYSGSAVVDWKNHSGLQVGDHPPILLFYTAAGQHAPEPCRYTQCLAFSTDGGETFSKYEKNPIVPHLADRNRDPKVIWSESNKLWYMVLYLEKRDDEQWYALFNSNNLLDWTQIQQFDIPGTGECPDLFPLSIDNNPKRRKWVFWAADGHYHIGNIDTGRFVLESGPRKFYSGETEGPYGNAYAAQTFSDIPAEDGRRIQIAWLRGDLEGMPFNQQMTVPIELYLSETRAGLRLHSRPVSELKSLREEEQVVNYLEIKPGENPLAGQGSPLMEVELAIALKEATGFALIHNGIELSYDRDQEEMTWGEITASLEPNNGVVQLRAIFDTNSVEVFGGKGAVYMPISVPNCAPNAETSLTVIGGDAMIVQMTVAKLKSIW